MTLTKPSAVIAEGERGPLWCSSEDARDSATREVGVEYGKNLLCHVGLASMLNRRVVLEVPPGMGSLIQERSVGL